jgi:hypothetical protein
MFKKPDLYTEKYIWRFWILGFYFDTGKITYNGIA